MKFTWNCALLFTLAAAAVAVAMAVVVVAAFSFVPMYANFSYNYCIRINEIFDFVKMPSELKTHKFCFVFCCFSKLLLCDDAADDNACVELCL